ncbi:MAG TPA: hypothetical protein DDZ96_03485 [Porphyromonadaceae bacterium]|uniref:DUF4625 domain-containing protein n=1 Tax=Limibacterium fermenti TaxID=3229863 RepID=UPI000E88FB71|nr:hypothetical protein [Porphyromonadaceae bacterium]HBL32868.1 hypothetical protein [Porphyromonadaceae bacterium]HBX19536.1 hypothetical protein [Porphyromonadaceae bacterium]HBX46590.1 hypothetical protein [Porphyromonadaceae bacterium]HCM20702.1 hypothetical protein [Porphyromonadaceae bacterium]
MKKISFIWVFLLSMSAFVSCEKEEIDKEKPQIDIDFEGAFPQNCATVYFGVPFQVKTLFRDNVELGSYRIDIHHNFDHHSHSTEVSECTPDPVKEAVNPYVFIQDYPLPGGQEEFLTDLSITLPASNDKGPFEDGDYHFMITLTDKQGWSTQKGLSIKIRHQEPK